MYIHMYTQSTHLPTLVSHLPLHIHMDSTCTRCLNKVFYLPLHPVRPTDLVLDHAVGSGNVAPHISTGKGKQ
jgi:hypothetical protein